MFEALLADRFLQELDWHDRSWQPISINKCWKSVPKATSGNSAMQGHSAMQGAFSYARVFSYAGHSAKHGFSVVIGAIWTCISIGLRSLQNGQSSEKHCT